MSYISFPIFIISFGIGLLFIYFWGPEYTTIITYPTPDNYMKTQYKDKSNQCFQYEPVAAQCPFSPLVTPVQN